MKSQISDSLRVLHYNHASGWSDPFPRFDSERTLVLAFGGQSFQADSSACDELRAAFPTSHILGCSTAGEIRGSHVFDDSLSVAVRKFKHTSLASASAPIRFAADSFRAGASLGAQLLRPGLKAVIAFSDGLNVNGTELVRGFNSVLPHDVILSGGLAGDGDRFKKTWVLRAGLPDSGLVSAVGFYGQNVRVGHGSSGGWSTFGPERTITQSSGNVLFELDGKPALELYKKYLGDRAADLPASALLFPLAVRPVRGDAPALVRTILAVSESDRSLTFAGDIPKGWSAQLMRANFDWIVNAAADSARAACGPTSDAPDALAIAVSCVGRRLILGERTDEELAAAQSSLPDSARLVGFYSYGELSPQTAGGRCELHNQTMTITTITES